VYVSNTKVKDLVEDLPTGFWSRLSTKVSLNIAPLTLELTLKERPEKRSEIRRQIESSLRRQGKLGSVDEPPQIVADRRCYVVGELTMRWALHEDIRPQILWFIGSTERTLVALGGRARHAPVLCGRAERHGTRRCQTSTR
jgi:hypothetical protein